MPRGLNHGCDSRRWFVRNQTSKELTALVWELTKIYYRLQGTELFPASLTQAIAELTARTNGPSPHISRTVFLALIFSPAFPLVSVKSKDIFWTFSIPWGNNAMSSVNLKLLSYFPSILIPVFPSISSIIQLNRLGDRGPSF